MAEYGKNGRLAEKLRQEYKDRGASLHGVRATSTSELMKRAQMGRDPKVNVSAEAFAEKMNARGRRAEGTPSGKAGAVRRNGADEMRRRSVGTDPRGTVTGNRAAESRRNNGDRRMKGADGVSVHNGSPRPPRQEKKDPRENVSRVRFSAAETEMPHEIRVARKRIPAGFLFVLAFCTVMIMMILMSVAQIYQTTGEISELEDKMVVLKETIGNLELKLDQKNDIRLIEQMATTELGMVKEDTLRRKYISLSDGERVELVSNDAETEEQGGSTMLSSFLSVFDDLAEYFR